MGMTSLLTITAAPDAVVACDMSRAEDTLAERLGEYRRLFDHALLGRDSTDTTATFRLAARPGVQDWVLDLVRREAACCPFLSYEVEHLADDDQGEHIRWTITGLGDSDMGVLADILTVAGGATSSSDIAEELEQRGGVRVIVPADR